jgi:hypothetical protein
LDWPVVNRERHRVALAQRKEMPDTYRQTIAGALRDVSNALIAYTKTREYRERQEEQTASAQDAVPLARLCYNSGSASYIEVLTNDANLYSSQLTLETAQQQEALSLIQLYNALGEAGDRWCARPHRHATSTHRENARIDPTWCKAVWNLRPAEACRLQDFLTCSCFPFKWPKLRSDEAAQGLHISGLSDLRPLICVLSHRSVLVWRVLVAPE